MNGEIVMHDPIFISSDYYVKMLLNIANKYELEQCDQKTISSLREDIMHVVIDAKVNQRNISELFPIDIDCGNNIRLKIYQNGEIYKHDNGNISYLHGKYF